ncbi:hypothetical protein ACLOJK_038766 [Asimina triloba]
MGRDFNGFLLSTLPSLQWHLCNYVGRRRQALEMGRGSVMASEGGGPTLEMGCFFNGFLLSALGFCNDVMEAISNQFKLPSRRVELSGIKHLRIPGRSYPADAIPSISFRQLQLYSSVKKESKEASYLNNSLFADLLSQAVVLDRPSYNILGMEDFVLLEEDGISESSREGFQDSLIDRCIDAAPTKSSCLVLEMGESSCHTCTVPSSCSGAEVSSDLAVSQKMKMVVSQDNRKPGQCDRVVLGRRFQIAVSSCDWYVAEILIQFTNGQGLNDFLGVALDAIWLLRKEHELKGVLELIKKLIACGANDFRGAMLRTSFLASCVLMLQDSHNHKISYGSACGIQEIERREMIP